MEASLSRLPWQTCPSCSGIVPPLHYRLAGPGGDIINTFHDSRLPLSLGTGELSPAMEQRLLGWKRASRHADIPPAGLRRKPTPKMQQWVARKLLNQMGDPNEQYEVGDVVQFPTPDGAGKYAGAGSRWARTATGRRPTRCCLTSTTRWRASRDVLKCM